jgi:MFS family permease
LGLSDTNSRIIAACNGTEYFFASFVGVALIERVGRRRLMLICAVGQSITMILLAILGSISNGAADIVSAVLLFVFNSIFAVGFLGVTWLYAAEIVGLNIRAPANALSTASNWSVARSIFLPHENSPTCQDLQLCRGYDCSALLSKY